MLSYLLEFIAALVVTPVAAFLLYLATSIVATAWFKTRSKLERRNGKVG